MAGKLVVIEKYFEKELKDEIRAAAAQSGYEPFFYDTQQDAAEAVRDADIVFATMIKYVHRAKDLKWLALSSAGADWALRPGVLPNDTCLLTNSSGAYGVSLAEHMLMLTLMLLRRMPVFAGSAAKEEWGKNMAQKSICGSRVTVLGTGDAGTTFAERVKAFAPACVTGVCRSGVSKETVYDEVLPIGQLDEVLPRTDILAMSLPGTKETAGILSEKRIGLLAPGAVVVNVGRGSAIDEPALIRALESGHLWGAGLDVMHEEPLPAGDPLWKAPNLILTPHVAGNLTLPWTRKKCVDMFCENLRRFGRGEPLLRQVDRGKGY